MEKRVSRNDPCPCGSGKKYKNCCMGGGLPKKKLAATWINQPKPVEEKPEHPLDVMMKRAFGDAVTTTEPFDQVP